MPKITINEVDLTKASLQPSATDIAFVPGFTCLSSFPTSPTFCDNIADFEKNFGTYPAITGMYRRYVYNYIDDESTTGTDESASNGQLAGYKKYRVKSPEEFADNFYVDIVKNTYYKNNVPTNYANGSLSGSTQVVLAVSDSQSEASIDSWMLECGLVLSETSLPEVPSNQEENSTPYKTSYFDFEYDMSYVYAKELIRAGIPVIYYVCKDLTPLPEAIDEESTIKTQLEDREDIVSIDDADAGSTYTLSYCPVNAVDYVKVNNTALEEVESSPSAGQYSIDKENGVITFGTALVARQDILDVKYNTYNTTSTYTAEYAPILSVSSVSVNGVPYSQHVPPALIGNTEYDVDTASGLFTFGSKLTNGDVVEINYTAVTSKTDYQDILSYVDATFSKFESDIDGILDRGEYSIKYVTSGAYPSIVFYKGDGNVFGVESFAFCGDMLKISGKRGDSVSLIDMGDSTLYENSTERAARKYEQEQMLDPAYLWNAVTSDAFLAECPTYTEYGALFAPWALYATQASYYVEGNSNRTELPQLSSVILPPSFGYLITLAKSIIINNNWVAVAGVARGQVPTIKGLYTASRLSNSLANYYQPRNGKTSINPITDIKPYGLTIWGNRTMKNNLTTANGGEDGLTATSFLNIRNMVSDVKKTAYVAAKSLMFEQNSDVLWVNFLSKVTPLLNRLMSGQGLSDYKVVKVETNEKAKLKATIKLFPIYAVEDFEITIELSDEDVSVV